MFGPWYELHNDSYQHVRNDGSVYEMIQAVWLDTTREDMARGLHEYCVVRGEIDLKNYSEEEMEGYFGHYGYTMENLRDQYGDAMYGVIAECILEEVTVCDSCVVANADSREEAKEIIMRLTEQN